MVKETCGRRHHGTVCAGDIKYCLYRRHHGTACTGDITVLSVQKTSRYCLCRRHHGTACTGDITVLSVHETSRYCLCRRHHGTACTGDITVLSVQETSRYCLYRRHHGTVCTGDIRHSLCMHFSDIKYRKTCRHVNGRLFHKIRLLTPPNTVAITCLALHCLHYLCNKIHVMDTTHKHKSHTAVDILVPRHIYV